MLITLIENHIKAEKRDEFIAFIKEHADHCVAEEGCIGFDILEDTRDPNTVFYYEVYKDAAAREAHMATPHLQRYRERIAEFREQPSVVHNVRNLYPEDDVWRRVE